MSDCWYIPEFIKDQRATNRFAPNKPGSYEKLAEAGLFYRHCNPADVSDQVDTFITPLLHQLGYKSYDVVQLSPAHLGEEKFHRLAAEHFVEHLHEDDEVRLILEGEGYFDIRDKDDQWIRVLSAPGDCLVVPAGIYHRFTTKPDQFIKTLRIFKENPKWIALAREGGAAEATEARQQYLARLHGPALTAVGPAKNFENHIFSFRFPAQLDAEFSAVVQQAWALSSQQESHNHKVVFLVYITGSDDPTTGQSWCPDCVVAKPAVQKQWTALQDREGAAHVYFVQLPVERAAYLGHPDYAYRQHPRLAVTGGVPTLIRLALKPDVKDAAHAAWTTLLEEEGRTTDPREEDLSVL